MGEGKKVEAKGVLEKFRQQGNKEMGESGGGHSEREGGLLVTDAKVAGTQLRVLFSVPCTPFLFASPFPLSPAVTWAWSSFYYNFWCTY